MNEEELEARAKADATHVYELFRNSQWLIVVLFVIMLVTVVVATAAFGYSLWVSVVFGLALALLVLVLFLRLGKQILTPVARWVLRSNNQPER